MEMKRVARPAVVLLLALAAAGVLSVPRSAQGFAVSFGELVGSFDTSIDYGVQIRTQDEEVPPSTVYAGRTLFPNAGDIISHQIKVGHELEMRNSQWGDATWGFFLRGNYFYDFEMDNQPLPDAAENRAVTHGDITDAFIWWRMGADDQITVRVGKQVISWGESTFFQGSLNDINTVDFTKLRAPGSAIKDAFIGTPALFGQWSINDSWSAEAFYLLSFQEVLLDPVGNHFGSNDRVRDGGGFPNSSRTVGSLVVDDCKAPDGLRSSCSFGPTTRIGDDIPSGSGQWGLAIRYLAPNFLTGFEFGVYYLNLHDHGGVLSTIVGGTPSQFGTHPVSPRFFLEYPENIERFGVSLNTSVGGWAIGAELGYRRNEPLQNIQALIAAPMAIGFGPSNPAYGPAGTVFSGYEPIHRYQFQTTFQRQFGPVRWLKTDQFSLLGEYAYGWVPNVPEPRFHTNGSVLFSNFNPVSENWSGIQIRTSQDYHRALFNLVNLRVTQAFGWDLDGVSTEVSPLFREDRKRFSLGFNFDWMSNYSLSISQTIEWGGEDITRQPAPLSAGGNIYSPLGDFFSVNFGYSF